MLNLISASTLDNSLMEAKLNQLHKLLFISKTTLVPPYLSQSQRFSLEQNKKHLLRKRFQGITEKLKFHVQEHWRDQQCVKQFLVHVVKEGETLTSISGMYGVSVQSIAKANESIVDINLVYEGQRLNIPSYGHNDDGNKDNMWKIRVFSINARDRLLLSSTILGGQGKSKIYNLLSFNQLLPAKTNGYFLLLVPLIAFCIRCIFSTFHRRVGKELKHRAVIEPIAHHHGPRGIRWKTALSDIRELDVLDAVAEEDSIPPEDQPPASFEEMSHAYTQIEPAYQKFLAECGMSESGYWRGGFTE